MGSPHDFPGVTTWRPRPARWRRAALLLGALAAPALAAGCGDETAATAPVAPRGETAPPAVPAAEVTGPPKFPAGVCERTVADRKSLPSAARATVERFVAAADQGDRETMRALFDPRGVDEVLAHLRPVTRLGLIALEDRY